VFTITSANAVPTISSLGATHTAGGAAFALTVNGTNFETKSVVNFNGKPETTKFISATKLSAAIPASDAAIVGNMNVTVTNPAPGGGTSVASPFTIDGYTINGPTAASLSTRQPAIIQITATPTANGFANSILFSVSGLPAGATASFNPAMLTPNGNATATTLTITDGSSSVSGRSTGANLPGKAPIQLLLAMWVTAIVGGLSLRLHARAIPIVKRYAALALFALILLTGSVLSGCALNVTNPSPSTSQLTVTATSGTFTQMFGITLTVTH
jgi:IPT/TIG domain